MIKQTINYGSLKIPQFFEYEDSMIEYLKAAIARTLYRSFGVRQIETNQIWPFQFGRLSRRAIATRASRYE